MKIVIQHHTPLPVFGYGGTERILFWHMQELARLGHQVVFIGPSKSEVRQYGIEHIPDDENIFEKWTKLIPKDTDIIHLNYNAKVHGNIPTINTVHGNGQPGEFFLENSVFVSSAHAKLHQSDIFVHNALNFDEYPLPPNFLVKELHWENFLFLAKASWSVKNLKDCVHTCRNNKKHLQVIGGRWWGISRYIHSHGILGGDKKIEIIKECDALLFPVRWPEPFGIAVIEAMAYGLPVIGSPYGSLPELVNSEAGFIAKNKNELNELIKTSTKKFNRKSIRDYVTSNFSINAYTLKYLELYKQVINGKNLNFKKPTLNQPNRAETLLDF